MRRAVAVSGTVIVLAAAFPAASQQQPEPFPWERNAKRYLDRGLPGPENPVEREIRDGLRKLGLPDQPQLDTSGDAAPPPEPPGLSATVLPRLDTDGNGYVSRGEYFASRQRGPVAGSRGMERYLQRRERFDSRFRSADSNSDGRLDAAEIDAMEGRRF